MNLEHPMRIQLSRSAQEFLHPGVDLNTMLPNGEIVPWLAAEGPFSGAPFEGGYTREVIGNYAAWMPGCFQHPHTPLSFGIGEDRVHALYKFSSFFSGNPKQPLFTLNGAIREGIFHAPLAVYNHPLGHPGYMLIQGANMAYVFEEAHPEIAEGQIDLYLDTDWNPQAGQQQREIQPQLRHRLADAYAALMSDSAAAFLFSGNLATDEISMCHLNLEAALAQMGASDARWVLPYREYRQTLGNVSLLGFNLFTFHPRIGSIKCRVPLEALFLSSFYPAKGAVQVFHEDLYLTGNGSL